MDLYSDEYLVNEVSKGNVEAFNALYNKYSGQIYNYIYRLIGEVCTVEDIFQDTFVRVIQNIDRYNPVFKFSTWIYTIASNLCFNELKKMKKNKNHVQISEMNSGENFPVKQHQLHSKEKSPLEHTVISDVQEKIKLAVNSLSENHRMVFIQKFYHNLSYKEIADIMNCSIGTVKSRIHYALEHLREILEE